MCVAADDMDVLVAPAAPVVAAAAVQEDVPQPVISPAFPAEVGVLGQTKLSAQTFQGGFGIEVVFLSVWNRGFFLIVHLLVNDAEQPRFPGLRVFFYAWVVWSCILHL